MVLGSGERGARGLLGRRGLLVFVLALIVGAGVLAVRYRRARLRKTALAGVEGSLRDYAECMLGAPLADGETASARLRRIEAGLPEGEPPGPAARVDAPGWPARCAGSLERAHASLAAPPLDGDPSLRPLDALLVRATHDPSPPETPDLVDQLLQAATRAGLNPTPRRYPPPNVRLAPPPAAPLLAEAFPPLPVRVTGAPDELPGRDPTSLRLAFSEVGKPRWVCTFTGIRGEPLREASCTDSGRGAVPVSGERPRAPGYLRTVRGRFDRFELVRWLPDANPDILPLPTSIETVALDGDQLVWVTAHRWYARTVTAGRAALGPVVDLGEVSGVSPELQLCETATAHIVAVKTFDEALPERRSWRVVASYEGNAWQRTPGRPSVDVGATLTCQGHEATFTWFDRRVFSEVRCNADRCETHASDPLTIAWDVGGALFAGDLGGRALLLGFGTTPGALSGASVASVRMRLAPLAALGHAPDVVLFSDAAHGGAAVSDVHVYVRDAVAVAIVKGDGPTPFRAIRVDALGNFAPVTLAN